MVGWPRRSVVRALCPQLCPRVASLWFVGPGGRWCDQLCPQLCPCAPSCAPSCAPAWRAYGWLAQEVGGASSVPPAVPPAVPPRGGPMDGKPRRSVARAAVPPAVPPARNHEYMNIRMESKYVTINEKICNTKSENLGFSVTRFRSYRMLMRVPKSEGFWRACGCFCGPPTSEARCVQRG